MLTTPDDIVNEALDEIGVEIIGDMFEGSHAANVARRTYDTVLRGMHASAPWNFARRQRQIDMRGDASGQYHANKNVPMHWIYMYEWPNDCVHARYVLGNEAYALDPSGAPLYAPMARSRHAPFLVTDAPLVNEIDSDWSLTEGHSPESTRVIVTNQLGAVLVYTGLVQYPDAWDAGFRRAFVASLAARLAIPLIADKGVARAMRSDQLQVAREALIEARVQDANEGWLVVDHTPDWIRARTDMAEDAGGVY